MIVDAAVHPTLGDEELAQRVGEPWRSAQFPPLEGFRYSTSFPRLVDSVEVAGNPQAVGRILAERGVDAAVLTPLTRGYHPNPLQAGAIAHATCAWLADRWLVPGGSEVEFFGSIRVPVMDPPAAVREIERWGEHDRYVQVAVPLRTLTPFGDDRYFSIWRAAAERGLPIYVKDDFHTIAEPLPTSTGFPRSFAEYHALVPFLPMIHIASLTVMGVFERLPDLRFVFADGSVDLCRALIWRLDKDWRAGRIETPWVTSAPTEYLARQVRFVTQAEDGTPDGFSVNSEQVRISAAGALTMFGSHYPHWDAVSSEAVAAPVRDAVLAGNALSIYRKMATKIAGKPGAAAQNGAAASTSRRSVG